MQGYMLYCTGRDHGHKPHHVMSFKKVPPNGRALQVKDIIWCDARIPFPEKKKDLPAECPECGCPIVYVTDPKRVEPDEGKLLDDSTIKHDDDDDGDDDDD